MAEQTDNRTERASAKRRAEARKKGQIAISRDVPMAAVVLAGIALLYVLIRPAVIRMTGLMQEWLGRAAEAGRKEFNPPMLQAMLQSIGLETLALVLPLAAAIAAAGSGAYLIQTGLLWRSGAFHFDPSRLNPLTGLGRLFSVRSLVDLVKAVMKVAVVALAGYMAIRHDFARLPELVQYDLFGALQMMAHWVLKMAIWIGVAVAVIAAADYGYQRFEWERGLRMTPQEVKEEHRESEGDPRVRSRIRSLQRQMARNRMMAAVPKADVVVTNPTHLAVALRYDPETMSAPVVVAKGAGYIAERIKALASEHGIMVIENKVVAQSLYKLVDIGREVPANLYRAVAEILALVYRARGRGVMG